MTYNSWTNYISNTCRSYIKSPGQKLERALGAQPNSSLRGHIWHRTSSTEMSACDGWALRRCHAVSQNHRYLEVPPGMTVGWGEKEKFPRYSNLLGALLIKLVYFLLNVKPRTTNITAASVQTWEKPLSSRGQEHIGALCEKEKYKLTARRGSQTMQPGGQAVLRKRCLYLEEDVTAVAGITWLDSNKK